MFTFTFKIRCARSNYKAGFKRCWVHIDSALIYELRLIPFFLSLTTEHYSIPKKTPLIDVRIWSEYCISSLGMPKWLGCWKSFMSVYSRLCFWFVLALVRLYSYSSHLTQTITLLVKIRQLKFLCQN